MSLLFALTNGGIAILPSLSGTHAPSRTWRGAAAAAATPPPPPAVASYAAAAGVVERSPGGGTLNGASARAGPLERDRETEQKRERERWAHARILTHMHTYMPMSMMVSPPTALRGAVSRWAGGVSTFLLRGNPGSSDGFSGGGGGLFIATIKRKRRRRPRRRRRRRKKSIESKVGLSCCAWFGSSARSF